MDYFVSVEDSFYMRWQIALLQESMRLLGIEDKLVLGVCGLRSDSPFNSIRHVEVENVGRKHNYAPLNKPTAVKTALESGILKQPFNLIDPDMVLVKRLPEHVTALAGHMSSLVYPDNVIKMGYEKYLKDNWVNVGCIYQFNNVDPAVFDKVIETIHLMLADDIKHPDTAASWQKEMVAFCVALANYNATLEMWESSIYPPYSDYVENVPVLHYANGFPPFFNKRMFTGDGILVEDHLPYSTILKLPMASNDTNCSFLHPEGKRSVKFENTSKFQQITASLLNRVYGSHNSS